jgi:hypothetical protein
MPPFPYRKYRRSIAETKRGRTEMNETALLRPAWTPLTIALMVIGFVVFWPLGLVMLAYIIWGDRLNMSRGE